jgi:hypothetical protein
MRKQLRREILFASMDPATLPRKVRRQLARTGEKLHRRLEAGDEGVLSGPLAHEYNRLASQGLRLRPEAVAFANAVDEQPLEDAIAVELSDE